MIGHPHSCEQNPSPKSVETTFHRGILFAIKLLLQRTKIVYELNHFAPTHDKQTLTKTKNMLSTPTYQQLLRHFSAKPRPRAIDLSQNISGTFLKKGGLHCQTAHMLQFLTHRCRFTVGIESMHFQTLHWGAEHQRLRTQPSRLLEDLAGNAFEAIKPF